MIPGFRFLSSQEWLEGKTLHVVSAQVINDIQNVNIVKGENKPNYWARLSFLQLACPGGNSIIRFSYDFQLQRPLSHQENLYELARHYIGVNTIA